MHLGLSTLEISKTLKHDFWHDYIKHKYQQNKNLCYMLTHSFIFKLYTTDERRNQLVSEPNYYTIKQFPENLLATEMEKTKVKMNQQINQCIQDC